MHWCWGGRKPEFRHLTDMTKTMSSRTPAIQRMIHPRSIAIVGASADLSKVNGRPLKHLVDKGYAGRILPVNPKYTEIAGLECYPDIASLPDDVDMAVIAVPAERVIASVEQLGERGVPAAVVFSSGFGEMGDAGRALEEQLAETARQANVVLSGPNCLGFINAFENVYATFSQYADGDTGPGPIGFVTQSGAFGTAIAALARQRGLGLGYFVNTGNECDLHFAELMLAVVEDPRIRAVAGYLEGVSDGEALIRLAERCKELGKPLVLTKVGRFGAGARAAASHTGALAVEDVVFDAVIRQHGILRARNEEQMLDMLEMLVQPRPCSGNGLGIATQSGGAGVMMADRAEEVGLDVPSLGQASRERLMQVMPAFGAAGNPVDVTGQFVAKPELLRESVITLLDDPEIDVAIVWLQLMTAHVDTLVDIFAEIQARTEKPFVVCWVAAPFEAVARLRAMGIAVYGAGERAVDAVAAFTRYHAFLRSTAAQADDNAPAAAQMSAANTPTAVDAQYTGLVPSVPAVQCLQAAGIPMVPVKLAVDADAAVAAWRELNCPVALKIESPQIAHKTDVGGVMLNLNAEEAIRRGVAELRANAKTHMPHAELSGVLVQPMAGGHVELVVGVKRDPTFGMIVMVGSGGILVEVLKDVSFRRAPFSVEEGLSMLADLRMAALLDGVRGRAPVDRRAVAGLLSNLSQWAAANPRLAELDLNPVLVGQDGPVAVDCVMLLNEVPE